MERRFNKIFSSLLLLFIAAASVANAEVPEESVAPGGYNYSADHPLRNTPISASVRAIANRPTNLATPEDASVAAAPLGMRFFIKENSNCRNPSFLVKLSYPRLIYELMEPQRIRAKILPINRTLRGRLCRQSLSEPWYAKFTVTSNGSLVGTFRLDIANQKYTFSEVQINWAAIDDTVVDYIDEYWKTGVVPDHEPAVKEALLSEGSADAYLVLGMRDRPEPKQTTKDFIEPYISQAIVLEHPRAAYRLANAIINEFEIREAAGRGRQIVLPQKTKDTLSLLVAKAYKTRYVPSYLHVALLRQQGFDIDQAIELVTQVGPTATIDDFYSSSIDLPPSWAQVRDSLRRHLNENNCSQFSALGNVPDNAGAGTAIMALGSRFESTAKGCRVTNSAFNTSITIGISTVDDLQCSGAAGKYTCSFAFHFDCGMSATAGVDLGIMNPCALLASIPVRATATLEKQQRSWKIFDYKTK